MRFLADMNISPIVVAALRRQGHDAVRLSEEGLGRLPDPDIMSKAVAEGRVLVTADLDFGDLLAASGSRFPSTILFRFPVPKPARIIAYLDVVIAHHSAELADGALIVVEGRKIRARRLPIGGREE